MRLLTVSLCLMIVAVGAIMANAAVVCSEGYTCAENVAGSENVVWVMKNGGNTNGPTCKDVCELALVGTPGAYHVCDSRVATFANASSFAGVAAALGFSCRAGGCWGSSAPGVGMQLVSIQGASQKTCYFPGEPTFRCDVHPGNANCFGERYASVCPCTVRPLQQACQWNCPNYPLQPGWPTDPDATDCLSRINYWRKRACDEGWFECPPAGLPPMTECTGCNRCGNSQARYDRENGGHASYKRCGERVQGVGGGSSCAAVIDSFVSERKDNGTGTMKCEGHCGPILRHGCQTFFFGHSDGSDDGSSMSVAGTYVLNWRSCNLEKCQGYCDSPSKNGCFTTPASPLASTYDSCPRVVVQSAATHHLPYTLLVTILQFGIAFMW